MTTIPRKKRDVQKQAIIKVFNKRTQRYTNVIIPSGITVGLTGDPDFERGITLNGPLEFRTTTAPDATSLKMYVVGTSLYFNGIEVGTSLEGSIKLKEQSAADADVAGYGQVWVKDDTPNTLYFTNDAGTDTQLGGGGAIADNILAVQVFS
jgi:hypothetical protein